MFARLWWRGRHAPQYRKRWAERLAFFNSPKLDNVIWMHAVSFGEVIASTPFMRQIQQQYPDYNLVITTTTPTGSARVQEQFASQVFHVYFPYDTPTAVRRFLNKVNPVVAIFVETEIWPNMYHACHQRNIPIMLANARLSARSAKGYSRLGAIARNTIGMIDSLAAQAQPDAERFVNLGADQSSVVVTGNMKFDIDHHHELESSTLCQQFGERPVWIAASTHEGEDEVILEAHKKIRKEFPQAMLLLVPRHPERFNKVVALCQEKDFSVTRRSDNVSGEITSDIFVGDSMGELVLFYAAADVVFVGGSLVAVGGHNLLEPASLSKPLLSGPHTFNFAAVTKYMIEAKALYIVATSAELADHVQMLFEDKLLASEVGQRARAVIDANQGSLEKHMQLLQKILPII